MKQKRIEWRKGQKELEWRIARQHLILNGEIAVNGTKLKRSNQHQPIGYVDQETMSEHHLEHSFIVVDNQILVMAGKGQVLGQNEFNKTKLAEDESGNLYTVKIQFTPLSNYFSGQENSIAVDVGFSSKQIDRVDMPDKAYSVSKYLGMPLDNYIRTHSLTEDERFNLGIKISLLIHELHTGKLSASETKYTHLDIKPDNIVIDTHGNPHLIDFGLAKISSTTPPQSAGSPLYLPEKLLISGPSYDVVALLKTLYLPEKIQIFGIEHDRTDSLSWLFSDKMVKKNRALTSLLDTSKISSEATMSALDVAKKLTLIRCGLSESSSIKVNFENIRAINALCTDGVSIKQEFLRPEVIEIVDLLHTSQIKLKEEYLTSSGREYVHFLKSIAQPTNAYSSEESFVKALLYTKQDSILQEAEDSVWDAVQTKAMNESVVSSSIKPNSGRFLDKDLLSTLNNELGTLEKAAESLGLGHVPMIQNVKIFRGLVILAKRLNNPDVDPMLAAVEGGVSVFGRNTGLTKIVQTTSDIIEGAVSHQSTQDPLENIICGTVGTATQMSIDVGFAAGFALYKIPAIAGSMYKVAAVRATCAVSYGSFSQNITSDVANLGGDLAEQACHFAFKAERERQQDENSQMLPPDMLHVGMPVDPNQASVLGKKMGEAIQALKKKIFEGGQSIADLIFSSAHATEHSEEIPVINSISDALRAMQPQNKSKPDVKLEQPDVTLEQYEDFAAQFHLATSQLYTPVPSLNGPNATYEMTKIPRKTSVAQISTRKSTPLQPKSDLSASKKDMKSSHQPTYKRKQPMVDVKHANELTDFLNQQSVQYIEKAEAARLASADLSQIYQHNKKPKSVLSEEHRLVVQKASHTMQELGAASEELSRFALHLGGHQRTWEGVGKFGNELSSLGSSLEKFSNANSLFSLQSFSGTLGTLNAVMGIADTLFGKKKESELSMMRKEMNQGFTMIMAALQAVYQDMMKGFQHLETLIQDNMYVVLERLQEINVKLVRLESIVTVSFREVQMKDLIDAIYKIKRDFKHKNLTDEQRKDLLEELGSWLENHCKSSIQTSVLRDSNDMATCVQIMGSTDFDSASMFPYLMRQLAKEHVIPHQLLLGNLWTQPLSNLELQHTVAEIYCAAIMRYKMTDNCRITPIENTLLHIQKTEQILSHIRDTPQIWQLLFRQYHHYRYRVGRAIAKCYAEITSGHADATPLQLLLVTGKNQERLMDDLGQMEFRRLLLIQLQQLTGQDNNETNEMIRSLESKKQILLKPKSFYDAANNELLDSLKQGGYGQFKNHLLYGANLNQWGPMVGSEKKPWGQAIHYILGGFNKENEFVGESRENRLHLLFMSNNELEYTNGTKYNYGTWGGSVPPVKWMLNCCNFQLALLWIANGYEIVESSVHFYNGYTWADLNQWNAIIQKYLVKEFNTKKVGLYNAYQYYRAFESGFAIEPPVDLNANCLLWLVCTLGNIEVLESISFEHFNINQVIPSCNFTPLMMAVFCGQEAVVEWLLARNADMTVTFTTVDNPRKKANALSDDEMPHLHFLAIESKQFAIANKLMTAGLTPTAKQKSAIEQGLSSLSVAASSDSKSMVENSYSSDIHSTLDFVAKTKHGLSETKAWLLEKKATDIRSQHQQAMDALVQRGIQQLNIDQKRCSMALRQMKQLMGDIRPLVEFEVLSLPDFTSKTEEMNEIESEFEDLIESVSNFTDEQFIAYEAPVAHTLPASSEEIPSLETHILEQRWKKETESLGFSFQRTTELLTQVASHFNALPKEKAPAVLFIGQTGAGKSTAVNGLLGVEYHKEKVKRKIIVHTEQPEYAKTNNSKKSETPFPKVFLSSDSSHYLVDMPGYGDTGGIPERISHGISTQWLRKRFQALKGMVIVCEENDINSSKCQLLRDTLENAGRMICQMPEQASQHLLFAATKSKEMSLDDIFEELRDLKEEFKASYKEDAPEHFIAIALSALTQSKEQIILLDVTDPESLAKMHQKIKIMHAHDATAFNFTHASPEFTLLRKVVQIILDIKTELEQDIQQRRDALASLYKTTLTQQLAVLDKSVDTITQECEAMLLSSDSLDCSSVKCFIDFVKWHSELIEKLKFAMTILSKDLSGTEKDRLIGTGQDLRAELIAQCQELQSNQAFFDSMSVIQDILNPDSDAKFSSDYNELDGYETDEGAADDLECFAKSIIPANHVLVENADKSEMVSIFKKRGTIPGEYESNPIYMGLVQHTLFKQPLRARYIGKVDEYADGVIVRLPTSQVV